MRHRLQYDAMAPVNPTRRGQLLLAGTDLLDPNFAQTVTLLVEHSDQGTLGLVLNRPLATTVAEAWTASVPGGVPCLHEGALYHGGPCEGPMMVLHNRADRSQIEVMAGLYFTSDAEDVTWLMAHAGEGVPAINLKCFVGYAGWTGGQLESELERQSWIVTPGSPEAVFDGGEEQWFDLLQEINPTQAAILRKPGLMPPDPSVN